MLKEFDNLEKGFQETANKSIKDCKNEIEELQGFILDTRCIWENHFSNVKTGIIDNKKWVNSLIGWCFFESVRTCGYTLYLTIHGLYRNAFDNIRHMLESAIQGLYLDTRYRGIDNVLISKPEPNIFVKLIVLREVEDKREYHVLHLIDELKIDNKDKIRKIYRDLSHAIHPSHKQIEQTMEDFHKLDSEIAAMVDCAEIRAVCESLVRVYEVLLVLILTYFPEMKKSISEDKDCVAFIKKYKLCLMTRLLKGDLPRNH